MFCKPMNYIKLERLMQHHALRKSTKAPFMLLKAIHTSEVSCRDYVYKNYQPPCHEDHDHKNMRLKRPMSPHLTIYGPTLPAMTSIAQRITGSIVTFYALILAGGSLFLSNGIDSIVSMIQSLNLNRFFIFLLKIIIGYPFAFHYFCGIRFCLFNVGKIMEKPQVYKTGYQAIIAGAVLAVFFALR
ncbi:succinate dehydrogenase cytochrome b560 subunit, mitochondrial-like isoform X2 [Leguminivora glycinivorella]|uniref:succinate dehydrogenase cytochrome b560 subunit, mitochondrial-like isoform X2 n=1 Tax=Leguminivora glycinivorella TaxID=1035111 RepID=UPI00200C5D16|nr:succinate dehydrogenase cytochrome b560 subunit, mitochondrial-like isoform X2 [Leguminivora glycinivorella]